MTLKMKAILGLLCLLILAACGPAAAPASMETPTLAPTHTPRPTKTPQPTETPTVPPAAIPTDPGAAATPAAGQPEAGQATAAPSGAAQPTAQPGGAQPAAGSGSSAPDKYTYLGQDIADQTQILPNRTVTITWTIQNTGTNGWTKDYTLRYFAGPEPAKTVYNFSKDVPVKDTINFIVTFTTPADPGDYDLWFKLTNAAGQNFGDLDLVFTVSNNPVKATPTAAK